MYNFGGMPPAFCHYGPGYPVGGFTPKNLLCVLDIIPLSDVHNCKCVTNIVQSLPSPALEKPQTMIIKAEYLLVLCL